MRVRRRARTLPTTCLFPTVAFPRPHRVETLIGSKMTLESQIMALESVNLNAQVFGAMQAGNNAMNQATRGIGVEAVEEVGESPPAAPTVTSGGAAIAGAGAAADGSRCLSVSPLSGSPMLGRRFGMAAACMLSFSSMESRRSGAGEGAGSASTWAVPCSDECATAAPVATGACCTV